jgi:hypothetical protein
MGRILAFLVLPLTGSATQNVHGGASPFSGGTETLAARFPPPADFERTPVKPGSFGDWLRRVPLKPGTPPVYVYPVSEGMRKHRQDVHAAVVDVDVMRHQECADAVIRLRAEYLWSAWRADEVCFDFTSGDRCCWERWSEGWRPDVCCSTVTWRRSARPGSSRAVFLSYLEKVMEFAGTVSLSRELAPIAPQDLGVGDVIVEGGSPGHAVLVLDMAANDVGERMMLLGQSFMPAQQFHVIKNPDGPGSPWYAIPKDGPLKTPQWEFDVVSHCRRFRGVRGWLNEE